jgi:glutathione S-transferase
MVLKLYGFRYSTCTMRVMIVLKEMKTPFEFVEVNPRAGEHKSPTYVEKQPFGQVPYIVCIFKFNYSLILSFISRAIF